MIFNNVKSLFIPEGEVVAITCDGRILWQKEMLPFEYQKVDYIESTGTQYIDTGVNADSSLCIDVNFEWSVFNTNNSRFVGTIKQDGSKIVRYHSSDSGFAFQFFVGEVGTVIETAATIGRHSLIIDTANKTAAYDGIVKDLADFSAFDTGLNVWLFGRNSNTDTLKNYSTVKIYGAKLWNSEVVCRNFIPCYRKSDGEVGMYDTVTKSFFANAGTGEFVCEKPKYKRELAYLESTGTQYIDTGIVGSQNTAYEIEASTSYNGNGYMVLFGSRQTATSNVISTLMQSETNIVSDFGNYQATRQTYSPINKDVRYRIYNSKDNRSVYSYETGKTGTVTTKYTGNFLTPTNLYIGHKTSGFTDAMTNFVGKVYGCKVWQDSVLMRDFIPVLDWYDVPCMYDKVSGELFYNKGTGTFNYA